MQSLNGVCCMLFYLVQHILFHYFFSYSQQKDELLYDLQVSKDKVEKYRAHIIRTRNQERSKNDLLEKLRPEQTHVTMDWAMKFLPTKFRESQQDWFAKKGMSWHITAAVTMMGENTFQVNQ